MSTWTPESISALGATTDLPTLGKIFGISRARAYEMAHTGEWQQAGIRIVPLGMKYRVVVRSILGVAVAEDFQDRLDGDDVLAAERDDADAGLLPFPGVGHLVGPGPGDAEDLPEGGQVGFDAECADRLGGPRAHQVSLRLLLVFAGPVITTARAGADCRAWPVPGGRPGPGQPARQAWRAGQGGGEVLGLRWRHAHWRER